MDTYSATKVEEAQIRFYTGYSIGYYKTLFLLENLSSSRIYPHVFNLITLLLLT
jgi:hypothetical protein